MSVATATIERWPGRRWIALVAIVFLCHVLLLFLASEGGVPKRRPEPSPTPIRLVDRADSRITELLNLHDPALFAFCHPHNFSGTAWFKQRTIQYRMTNVTEPARGLALQPVGLGGNFSTYVAREMARPVHISQKAPPVVAPISVAPATDFASRLVMEGAVQKRTPVTPVTLPVQVHDNVLSNSVVRVIVDEAGQTISAVLLAGCGLPRADDMALQIAKAIRYHRVTQQPLEGAPPSLVGSGRWDMGNLIFDWATVPPPSTNAPSATASAK